jgi:hypothetical protein
VSPADCARIAKESEADDTAGTILSTRSHFVQIAIWPLTATLYGFMISLFFRFVRQTDDQPIDEVIELFPHIHHITTLLFAGTMAAVTVAQNMIGT